MKNVISQSLGLDLININVYATVYQNIPLNLRDWAIFTFSEFGALAKPRSMINVILQGTRDSSLYLWQWSVWHNRRQWNSILCNWSLLLVFVKLVKALWSNITCRKLSGLLVGEYTPVHIDNIISLIRFLRLAKAGQWSRKCSTVSFSRWQRRHTGLTWFWLNVARIVWSI